MEENPGWPALLLAAEEAPEARLRFEAEERAIRDGFHVTELRRARVDAIDCGLERRSWEEAQLQILDGQNFDGSGGTPMRGRTLAGILRRSAEALDLPKDAALRIEAAPGGGALRRYRVGAIEAGPASTVVALREVRAECRPAARTGCCSPQACCA